MWFEAGKRMFGALLRDITDRQAAKDRLEYLAHCDTLTSLPNRNALHGVLAPTSEGPCSLLLLDLDGFKHVNDSLGHSVGDQLLAAVATRLTTAVGATGFVARLGGDEFAVLLSDCADPLRVEDVATRIFLSIQSPFELAGQSIYVGTSIGIAMSPNDAADVDQLLSRADLALYTAKSEGGGTRAFFVRAMQNSSEQRRRLGVELRQALANFEFELLYQPQVSLADNSLRGFEALLRWRHPDHGLLSPQAFLEVLESSAIAEEVGDWILDRACAAAADWKRIGLGSVRVWGQLVRRPATLGSVVQHCLIGSSLTHGLSPAQLELEITENTVLRHNSQSTSALGKLKALGVSIAFDDFGNGLRIA